MTFLAGCGTIPINTVCPPVVSYTTEETDEIEKVRIEVNNIILNRFLKDYLDLRDNIKKCNAKKF
jgi:hypothetical protein